jgi:hypothetical protein
MDPCIFCGAPADSKEDLFPRWILKRVKTGVPLYRKIGDKPATITEDQEVRVPCVCAVCNNTWMSGMETTAMKFLEPMLEGRPIALSRQNQQNLAEWALKCAMCQDTLGHSSRFFRADECHAFKRQRTIPNRTIAFVAHYDGSSLDSNGTDFTLVGATPDELLARGHIYTVMVGHAVVQVLSMHEESAWREGRIEMRAGDGPWDKLEMQIWPIENRSIVWPPPMSLSIQMNETHYGHFRSRFRQGTGHRLLTPKAKPPAESKN